jgi:hypothetical protein
MKKLKVLAFCLVSFIVFTQAAAQTNIPLNEPDYNKPKIFSDLPQQMTLQVSEADQLFNLGEGELARVQVTSEYLLKGQVVSIGGDKSGRTVIIRIPERNNAIFTFTRKTNADGVVSYVGRILSRNNGDAYEIKKENGQYIFNKVNLYDLISE